MKLDLGSGPSPREGFTGVDVCGDAGVAFDLCSGARWPFGDGSVEELYSSHFIEHITAGYLLVDEKPKDALFFFFDECFRVTGPGARFSLVWPSLKSVNAFQDPTHRRFLPLEFLHYLSREGRRALRVEQYNVSCDWIVKETRLVLSSPADVLREDPWTGGEAQTLWDVQKEWQVLLERGPG